MTTRVRKQGEFCWINMITPQPELAREFFGKLLGWTYFEITGMGHGMQVGGQPIGGLFDLNGPNVPPGTPPHIGVMVKADNADAMGEKIKSLGGSVKAAFDIQENGRMVCGIDPNGARFDLWQPKAKPGTEVDTMLQGAPSWFETLTSDADRGTKFYTALFGWTPQVIKYPEFDYTVFSLADQYVAGMMQFTPEMVTAKMQPHWGVYFTVNDVDETAKLATQLGAKLCVPPKDIPEVGRFCGIISPQGVMFYAIKYTG